LLAQKKIETFSGCSKVQDYYSYRKLKKKIGGKRVFLANRSTFLFLSFLTPSKRANAGGFPEGHC